MKPISISLRHIKKHGLCFLINNIRHDEYLSHEERVACLIKTNHAFDNDFEKVALEFKNHRFGAYLWVYTSEFLRGEAIASLLRLHYLKAILQMLTDKYQIDVLVIESHIPLNIRLFLKQLGLKIHYKKLLYFYSLIRYNGKGVVNILESLLKNFKFLFKKNNCYHEGVLADINTSFTTHRYDSIEKVISLYPKIKFFSGQESILERVAKDDAVVFRKELNFKMFFGSFVKTLRIMIFILKNKKNIPPDLYHNLSDFYNLILYFDLIIFEKSVEKYLDKNNIRKIIHLSTLTRPTYRILMSYAKKHGIEFILVASRTLMKLRSSERILTCDVNEYNNTSLPDWFIFKDIYSTKIFDDYPELQKKVFIGGRYLSQEIHETADKPLVALLILFNHFEDLCFKLLKEIDKTGVCDNINTIIYRCHPLYHISKETMQTYFPKNELINISGKDYSELNNYRTITVTGPTTGALEAVQEGSVILWVPYIWDDGILLDDMMNNVGIKCKNIEILTIKLRDLLDSEEFFSQQIQLDTSYCNTYFQTKKLISAQLKDFIN